MFEFLANNYGTLIVAAVLTAIVVLVLRKIIKDKKEGKSSCNCGCEGCPNAAHCHRGDGCGRYRKKEEKSEQ